MHIMATHQRGAGCPLDRCLDMLTEDPEHTTINNESTHSLDGKVALGGPEAVGYPQDPVYSNQDTLTALMREIKNLHQWVAAGEWQPAETLDCIVWTSKSLSSTPSATSTHTCWTSWRSNTAIHRYFVYYTEAVISHKPITAGYSCFQWAQLYQAGRLAHSHWDGSRPHQWKQT